MNDLSVSPGGNSRRKLVSNAARAIGARLFRDDDALAGQLGWQASPGRDGLSRSYRDPRFDRFQSCRRCHGNGVLSEGQDCGQCDGTGRIVTGASAGRNAG